MAPVVLVICHRLLVNLVRAQLSEHALNDASEEVVVLVELGECPEEVLVGEETLLEALIEELAVCAHHVVDCVDVA